MARKRPREIPSSELVRRGERWATSFNWPAPIDAQLDALVELAVEAGESDSLPRTELIAALVASAPTDGSQLRAYLERYRSVTVGELSQVDDLEDVIRLKDRQPGRRTRR